MFKYFVVCIENGNFEWFSIENSLGILRIKELIKMKQNIDF